MHIKNIRGVDTRSTHKKALMQLEKHNISTNLVCAVRKSINDHEIGDIITYAQQWKCIRSITFQPIQMSFMDKYNFDLSSIKRSCTHFVEPNGKIYPFETWNMFYRQKKTVNCQ
jgi:uncharacterized radical SAM superfamily Fe-S cluster-containing enzyme